MALTTLFTVSSTTLAATGVGAAVSTTEASSPPSVSSIAKGCPTLTTSSALNNFSTNFPSWVDGTSESTLSLGEIYCLEKSRAVQMARIFFVWKILVSFNSVETMF